MFCGKCGNKLDDDARFCPSCGNRIEHTHDNFVQFNDNGYGNNPGNYGSIDNSNLSNGSKSNNSSLNTVSMIIGIIALIFAVLFRPFALVLGIVGLVLGLISKNKDKKRKAGIILSIIAIVVRVITIILGVIGIFSLVKNPELLNRIYNELDYSSSNNYIAGTWNCAKFDGSSEVKDYTITMKLNKDKSFLFGQYGDLTNNHAGGTYTFEDEKDKNENNSNGYKYYILNLNGAASDYIVDGVSQDRVFNGKFEMGVTAVNTKKQAILMNYNSYQMYSCYMEN